MTETKTILHQRTNFNYNQFWLAAS